MNECIKGIFKLKNGNWKCDKIYNGVRITKICSTKNEILTFLKQKILEIDNMKNEKLDSFSKVLNSILFKETFLSLFKDTL